MRIKKLFHPWFWRDLKWQLKWGFYNLFRYKSIVWRMHPYDYGSILLMMRFQLKELHHYIKNGREVEESRNKKLEDIERVLELLTNKIEDNFLDRQGELHSSKYDFEFEDVEDGSGSVRVVENRTEEERAEDWEKMKAARKLELEECKEIFKILAEGDKGDFGLYSWWD